MKTFDMVQLPAEESWAHLWLRLSILGVLVNEARFIVFRDENETAWRNSQKKSVLDTANALGSVTRSRFFDLAPEEFDLNRLNWEETGDRDLVFDVSMADLKRLILELCEADTSRFDENSLAFQIGLPGRSLVAKVAMNTTEIEPEFIALEFPLYTFSHDDFNAVHLFRGGSPGFYQMSFPLDEEKVYYKYFKRTDKNSHGLLTTIVRFLKSLLRRKNPNLKSPETRESNCA